MSQPTRVKGAVDRALSAMLALLFGLLVLDVLWQVLSRYVLGSPASFTEEVARFAFMWLALLSAAYVGGQKGHLAIDLLPQALSPRNRRGLLLGLLVLSLAFVGSTFVYGGGVLVVTSLELGQRSPVLGVPLGFVYAIVPISGFLLSFYLGVQLVELLQNQEEAA